MFNLDDRQLSQSHVLKYISSGSNVLIIAAVIIKGVKRSAYCKITLVIITASAKTLKLALLRVKF